MSAEIVLAGLVVGLLIGLTGIGGGSIITPFLVFGLGVQPLYAVGTDLTLGAITKIAGAIVHTRTGNIHTATIKLLLTGSVPGAFAGLLLLRLLPSLFALTCDSIIEPVLGGVLLLVSFGMFFPSAWNFARRLKTAADNQGRTWIIRGTAFFVGFMMSVTSVGSGSLLVPLMLAAFPFPLSRIIGIDLVHGAILSSFGAIGHVLVLNSLNHHLLLNLLAGSIPGAIVGSKLSVSFPRRIVEILVGSMLAVSGMRML